MADESQTYMKRAAIAKSEKTILLIDHTKFGKKDYILLSDFNSKKIKTIITDKTPSTAIAKNITSSGIDLIVTSTQ